MYDWQTSPYCCQLFHWLWGMNSSFQRSSTQQNLLDTEVKTHRHKLSFNSLCSSFNWEWLNWGTHTQQSNDPQRRTWLRFNERPNASPTCAMSVMIHINVCYEFFQVHTTTWWGSPHLDACCSLQRLALTTHLYGSYLCWVLIVGTVLHDADAMRRSRRAAMQLQAGLFWEPSVADSTSLPEWIINRCSNHPMQTKATAHLLIMQHAHRGACKVKIGRAESSPLRDKLMAA